MPYNIGGQIVNIPEEPTEKDGRHYVPLAAVVQALGGSVAWDNTTKTAAATIGQWTAHVQEGSDDVMVNTTPVTLDAPPYIENDKMFVPWDFFKVAYGYKADIEGGTLYIHL
jgi:hypothetical protein